MAFIIHQGILTLLATPTRIRSVMLIIRSLFLALFFVLGPDLSLGHARSNILGHFHLEVECRSAMLVS